MKLHGRTAHGTWVQLEKTPASFGKRKLPSWQDVLHLADYFMYRLTRSNIGPWGRSGATERRPMYLSPDLRARRVLWPLCCINTESALGRAHIEKLYLYEPLLISFCEVVRSQ